MHYLGSPSSYLASTVFFPYSYHRVTYYGAAEVNPDTVDENPVYEMQFFPYLIYDDHYGQVVIPENLGNLQYTPPAQSADFLLRNAAYGLAVRDGVASLFVHSFLFVPYNGLPAHSDFSRVLSGITDMGYEWVDPNVYLEMQGLDPSVEVTRLGSN